MRQEAIELLEGFLLEQKEAKRAYDAKGDQASFNAQ